MLNRNIEYRVKNHRGEKRIFLEFSYSSELNKLVRGIPGRRFSATYKKWHLPWCVDPNVTYAKHLDGYVLESKKVETSKKVKPKVTMADRSGMVSVKTERFPIEKTENSIFKISPDNLISNEQAANLQLTKEDADRCNDRLKEYIGSMQLKRLSKSTQEQYLPFFKKFTVCNKGNIQELDYRNLYSYIRTHVQSLGHTRRKQLIAAIKFYYEKYLGREKMFFNLGKVKDLAVLPVNLDFAQIKNLLKHIASPHDRLLLFLAYHFNLTPRTISLLTVDTRTTNKLLPVWAHTGATKTYYNSLLEEHLTTSGSKKWLFEKNEMQRTTLQIRKRVYRLLSYYQLKEIYRKQLREGIEAYDYAPATQRQYISFFMKFLEAVGYKHPSFLSKEDIMTYLVSLGNRSGHLQNNVINSLNFFFAKIYKKPIPEDWVLRPKKGNELPDVFEKDEIRTIFETTHYLKHKLMFAIIYGGGLRRGELLRLKLDDLNLKKGLLFVKGSKGRKDRFTLITPMLKEWVQDYLEKEKPVRYLFEGQQPGNAYTATSLANALKTAATRAGIQRRVHLHMLRHSFTTHLIEEGEDISVLQKLLGHGCIKTTQRYTHMTNKALRQTRSPMEDLAITLKNNKFSPGLSP